MVDKFCYLGSVLSTEASIDVNTSARLVKASAAYDKLTKRLWNDHGIRLATKIAVYKAVVLPTLPTLLYDCEPASPPGHSSIGTSPHQFHLCCLRTIAHKWQDKTPNIAVLER